MLGKPCHSLFGEVTVNPLRVFPARCRTHAIGHVPDGVKLLLKCELSGTMGEGQRVEPAHEHLRPGLGSLGECDAVAEEEAANPLRNSSKIVLGVSSGSDEVSQGLVVFAGNPVGGQLTGVQQLGEAKGVSAITDGNANTGRLCSL